MRFASYASTRAPSPRSVSLKSQRGDEADSTSFARDTASPYNDNRPLLAAGKPELREGLASGMRVCPERRGNRFVQRRSRGKLRAVSHMPSIQTPRRGRNEESKKRKKHIVSFNGPTRPTLPKQCSPSGLALLKG